MARQSRDTVSLNTAFKYIMQDIDLKKELINSIVKTFPKIHIENDVEKECKDRDLNIHFQKKETKTITFLAYGYLVSIVEHNFH